MANQHNSNRQNKPISSDFYDELEAATALGHTCDIRYQDQDGSEQVVTSPVKDLFTENGREYARLENKIIPLDRILSLNGKTAGGGPVHTQILETDRMPADAGYISPIDSQLPHEGTIGYSQPIPNTDTKPDSHDSTFKGDISEIGNTGIPSVDNGVINPVSHGSSASVQPEYTPISHTHTSLPDSGKVHQNEEVTENLLGMSEPTEHTDAHHALIIDSPEHTHAQGIPHTAHPGLSTHKSSDDFVHTFTTSAAPFVVGENDLYRLQANRLINRLDLIVKQDWYTLRENRNLGADIARIAPLMGQNFTLLIDLTALTPDAEGTLMSPAIANKSMLFNAGLAKVAEIVPYNCDTLVHGPDSISVNSVRLRYFKDRIQAENWLNDDPAQVGTPDDMDLN